MAFFLTSYAASLYVHCTLCMHTQQGQSCDKFAKLLSLTRTYPIEEKKYDVDDDDDLKSIANIFIHLFRFIRMHAGARNQSTDYNLNRHLFHHSNLPFFLRPFRVLLLRHFIYCIYRRASQVLNSNTHHSAKESGEFTKFRNILDHPTALLLSRERIIISWFYASIDCGSRRAFV